MNTKKQEKQTAPWLRLCIGALGAGGVALSTLGLTSAVAQAAPPPAPGYHHHWCPGDQWNQGWGNNPNLNQCRDWDDNYDAGYGRAPQWAPPQPPPPMWAPNAQIVWNNDFNGWGFWNNGMFVRL